jgi:hypothetical protein
MASSKKLSDFGIKAPKQMISPDIQVSTALNSFSKWVPLICAGAAVGVSVLALKEIKNVRKELINLKKESLGSAKTSEQDPELLKRIELMDEQLRKITQYLANQNKSKESPIVKNVSKPAAVPVKIINDSPEPDPEVEYEEQEVTDDEAEA